MSKSFFLTFLALIVFLAAFIVCAIGLDWCLDLIGPDPECTDLQLAYFGVGLFSIFLIGSVSDLLSILFAPLIDRLSRWVSVKLKTVCKNSVSRK